jgi:hypothetical protein
MKLSEKSNMIAQISKDFYNELEIIRAKNRKFAKSADSDYYPVSLKKRKLVLKKICKEHDIDFEFMCKLLRVNENNNDIIRFM